MVNLGTFSVTPNASLDDEAVIVQHYTGTLYSTNTLFIYLFINIRLEQVNNAATNCKYHHGRTQRPQSTHHRPLKTNKQTNNTKI